MTNDQFSQLLSSIQSAELQVREDGHKEYAHDESNVFANFDRVADSLKLDRKQVLLVHALKHWDGIISYINGHKSQREDVRGRIKDLRMYLVLLWGMIEEDTMVCRHDMGCGCEKVEVTTHADGPDSRKLIFRETRAYIDDPDIVSERIFPNGI